MTTKPASWLLLVTNLPGHNPTLRMRIWRAMRSEGAGLLRDGAYLLPSNDRSRKALEEQAVDIKAAGGAVHLLLFEAESAAQNAEFILLFDRTAEYAEAIQRLSTLKRELTKLSEPEARQRLASVAREVTMIVARDFFPAEPRKQMDGALAVAEAAINARFAPDEPRPAHQQNPTTRPQGLSRAYLGHSGASVDRPGGLRLAHSSLYRSER